MIERLQSEGHLLMPKQAALTKIKTPEYHLPKPLRRVKEKSGGEKRLERKKVGVAVAETTTPKAKNA